MRVLFAEDDRQLRVSLTRGLREASHAVNQAATGLFMDQKPVSELLRMNRIRRLSATAVVALFSLLAPATAAAAQPITGTVQGAGTPVVGARVRLVELNREVRTGARGQFTISDVPKGTYKLFVAVIGFAPATKVVDVTSGTATTSFELKAFAIPLNE